MKIFIGLDKKKKRKTNRTLFLCIDLSKVVFPRKYLKNDVNMCRNSEDYWKILFANTDDITVRRKKICISLTIICNGTMKNRRWLFTYAMQEWKWQSSLTEAAHYVIRRPEINDQSFGFVGTYCVQPGLKFYQNGDINYAIIRLLRITRVTYKRFMCSAVLREIGLVKEWFGVIR